MKAKKIVVREVESHIKLANILVWTPFRFKGKDLRVVPCSMSQMHEVCRGCYFEPNKMTSLICPYMDQCCAHKRADMTSVKFISAAINGISNEEDRASASKADKGKRE